MIRRRLRRARREGGMTLVEILLALPILVIGLLAVLTTMTLGMVQVSTSGGQSKATAYARQRMEQLKNAAFDPGPTGPTADAPEAAVTRTWTVAPVGGFAAPNAVARITVVVSWQNGSGTAQSITLETMRAQ